MADNNIITVDYRGRVAVIMIDNQKRLNALSKTEYYKLAVALREIAKHDEVYVTVILAKGRYFSAGADVSISRADPPPDEAHLFWLREFAATNLNVTLAFSEHPKILVVGLNGPAVGLSAALVGHADFVYAAPAAFLLTPFSSLALVAEGGASRALAARLGPARAADALIASRRIGAEDLERCGFVNAIFADGEGQGGGGGGGGGGWEAFHARVLREVDDRLGPHLSGESMLAIKKLLRDPDRAVMESQNSKEIMAGVNMFVTGRPQEEFRKIASGEKRHKL